MAPTEIQAEQTVGDVAHRHAGTLEVMKRVGINHCCGAQLTLAQAAVAAGVSIGTLLEELNEARTASSS